MKAESKASLRFILWRNQMAPVNNRAAKHKPQPVRDLDIKTRTMHEMAVREENTL